MSKLNPIVVNILALLTLTFASVAQTPTQPAAPADSPALALLKQVAETYRKLDSYHFEGRYTYKQTTEAMGMKDESSREETFVFAALKPGRTRVESRNSNLSMTVISDGKTKWEYAPGLREYTAKPVNASAAAGRPTIDPLMVFARAHQGAPNSYQSLNSRVQEANLVGEEVLTVAGERIPCVIVEVINRANETSTQANQSARKLWVDKTRHLVLREVMRGQSRMNGNSVLTATITWDYTVARLNEQVSEDLFTFICPAGAKEVAELNTPFRPAKRTNWTGKDALAFTLKDLDDKPFDLASLKGQVVLLDFWATWCGPCVAELPHIQQLHQDFKDKGLLVLGIDDEEAEIPRAFLKDKGYTFTSLVDAGRTVIKQYEISGIPQVLIIGRDGKVKWHSIGFGPGKEVELRAAVAKVLNGEDPPPSSSFESAAPPVPVTPAAPAPAEAPKQIRVSSAVLQASAIKKVQPPYPAQAKAERIEGAVQVQVLVAETGQVSEAVVISGPEALREATLQAAKQWEFKPTELSGVPVKVQGVLTFNFTLQ